ncbi:MAG: T9SS type A sorting domain-containing protein [Flavobacteriales bacterium]|jgi:endonuclease I|nr:MAG: T9SS type A sorting domain-containing protein [Flavobacteriales bacterium]
MRPFLLTILFGSSSILFAQPPAGYYDTAEGLTGEPLRQALRDIIDGHTVLTNSALWNAFAQIDRKPNGKVWDIYSDVPGGTPPYQFDFGTHQCSGTLTYDGEGDCFNREHTFPSSWFNDAAPPSTDLFHIYPTDAWVNQKRANWPYGTVGSSVTYQADNGGKLGQCTYSGCSGLAFEPIDTYKGDLARGYFYILTRYMDDAPNWTDAPVLDQGEFLPWVESLLLAWHQADPVSQKEVDRNNAIYGGLQHNRNPYIDHPEWVYRIWGPTASMEDHQAATTRAWLDDDVIRYDRMGRSGKATLNVYNAMGTLVRTTTLRAGTGTIPFDLPAGAYIIVLDDGARSVHRVVR